MKRIFFLLPLLAGVLGAQTPPASSYKTIITSWTAPTVYAGCVPAASGDCALQGYTETLTPPTGVTGGNVVIPIGLVSTYSWAPGGNLYCGTWSISLVANWLDGNGNAVASAPATGTVVAPCPFVANPPSGLSIKAQ